MFEKSYTPKWTEEVFTVSKIHYTDPPTYKIKDYNDDEIQVHFTSKNCKRRTRKFTELKK